ncbi:site-specific DNA-methyltransferase [Mesorhizobium sp. B3-1-7]|uniref:site-specific DNA-methyltransferase n=1 Tax=Mesorhizobium sp. B3-1-7 TaxID=2589894 RepID=UPI00112A99D7|nr:site-specific DNA-methyltransferase [Mesorhizobium sp. B3-1-7]TPI58239.1 site-specific DNA-methyltransferase [Mesorhizobium sp. B3-1-7]
MSKKTRLELTWIGKDERPRLEPRILIEDAGLSDHAAERHSGEDIFDNILIHGDNLLALKALEANFAGKIKCIYIDPPYNTGAAFTHYDDGLEHSVWLSMIRDRIELLRRLLSNDGSLWINIDENEGHYLKVVCDEVFGRENFVRQINWQKKYSASNNFKGIASLCDLILVYRKSDSFANNLLPRSTESEARYSNPDNDPRGPWKSVDYLNQASVAQRPNLVYEIENPFTGELVKNRVKAWKYDKATHAVHVKEDRLWWGLRGENSVPALKLFLSEVRDGMTPHNWWPHAEVGHTDEAKKESIALFGASKVFDTPKPERLIQRIVQLSTNPGDLVLDSFAGSGTTGAVAHKMSRRWIMVELGDHAVTHIAPRLKKVIDGDDPGGVTDATGWKGGGGFRFYRLAPSLLEKDRFGNWVIAKEYNAAMLAEALCKHLGFTYTPSQDPAEYWRHGHSTETDFVYVTTQSLTYDALKKLSEEVGPKRTLLVCCKAFNAKEDSFPNLTVKKIPHSILAKCEWGRDDYSLRIANLPEKVDSVEPAEPADRMEEPKRGKAEAMLPLFDIAGEK